MYIIVATALSAGLKIPQAVHAFRAFIGEYPLIDAEWHAADNNIVVLQHEDVPSMAQWLKEKGYKVAPFFEPDLDDQMTAVCIEPSGGKHLGHLPLAY